MATLKTRPRYRFCWWCSRQLRGSSHRIMRGPGSETGVIVHCDCADEMRTEGWAENDNAPQSRQGDERAPASAELDMRQPTPQAQDKAT